MVVVFFNQNEAIFRSFGFDIENYISNDLSETLFRLFQERGFIRTAPEKISNLTNSLIEIYLEMIDTATIFIPLSFLAGVYGMNFEYFTEVKYLKISKNHKKHWFSIADLLIFKTIKKRLKKALFFFICKEFYYFISNFFRCKTKIIKKNFIWC